MSTFVQYPGNGTQRDFSVPFTFLNPTHLQVKLNGVLQVNGADYDWVGPSTIQFRPYYTPVTGAVIELRRVTPLDSLLVMFQNSAVLTAEDLNTATHQLFYITQEIKDLYEGRITNGLSRLTNGTAVTAEQMIEAITQDILQSQLLADLQARITDIDTNAQSILQQTLRLDTIDADFFNEQTARINGDSAIAQTIALMGARSGDNTAFILNTATAKVSPTQSLAQLITTLTAADGDNSAAISSLATVVTGPGGLTAQYMVKTDVNGYVSGYGLYNTGVSSEFIVLANKFAVVTPGQTPKVPFAVVGGVVYMQNVVIQDALINNLTITKLTHGNLNADMNVGTGRIIWSNGSHMKVAGVGFGTGGQFIEWFGPSMSISSCSEANAIYYLKTNGNAYFGGSLSAGTLKTSGQTSDTTTSATVTIGPFGTNGNPINVVLSYTFSGAGAGGTGQQDASYPISGSIQLYRTIAPGVEALVATLNVSGACVHGSVTPGEGHSYSQSMSGSTTYADTAGGTGNRTYRAVIASRSVHHNGNQNISIVATE